MGVRESGLLVNLENRLEGEGCSFGLGCGGFLGAETRAYNGGVTASGRGRESGLCCAPDLLVLLLASDGGNGLHRLVESAIEAVLLGNPGGECLELRAQRLHPLLRDTHTDHAAG